MKSAKERAQEFSDRWNNEERDMSTAIEELKTIIEAGEASLLAHTKELEMENNLHKHVVGSQARRIVELKEALRVAKRGIRGSATDTVWCLSEDMPNCTVVDFINTTLKETE